MKFKVSFSSKQLNRTKKGILTLPTTIHAIKKKYQSKPEKLVQIIFKQIGVGFKINPEFLHLKGLNNNAKNIFSIMEKIDSREQDGFQFNDNKETYDTDVNNLLTDPNLLEHYAKQINTQKLLIEELPRDKEDKYSPALFQKLHAYGMSTQYFPIELLKNDDFLEEIMEQMKIRHGQHWLINAMKACGYKSEQTGVCFSYTGATNLILTKHRPLYLNRLLTLIANIPAEKLPILIKSAQRIWNSSLVKAMKTLKEKYTFNIENFNEYTLTTLQKKEMAAITDTWLQKADLSLFTLYLDILSEMLPGMKPYQWLKLLLDVPAFMELIELSTHRDKNFFTLANDEKPATTQDATLLFAHLKRSVTKNNKLQLKQVNKMSGIYTTNELKHYFSACKKALEVNDVHLRLVLGNGKHNISLIYDPKRKNFLFNNANDAPIRSISWNDLANRVMKALQVDKDEDIAVFSTLFYCTEQEFKKGKKIVAEIKQNSTWKQIHQVTEEKIHQVNNTGTFWLWIASKIGDVETANLLLKNKADPNKKDNDGWTSLHIASQNGHKNIVELLLNKNAIYDILTGDNDTARTLAKENEHNDIVEFIDKHEKICDQNKNSCQSIITKLETTYNKSSENSDSEMDEAIENLNTDKKKNDYSGNRLENHSTECNSDNNINLTFKF